MDIPVGEWTKRDTLNALWRREGLMVLLWGLKIVDPMPHADKQVDIVDLLKSAWLFKDTRKLRTTVQLRSPENINKARDLAEFWLWRVRTTQLQNSPNSANDPRTSKEKLEAIIAHAAETGERDGLFKRIGGDFPAFGSFSGPEPSRMVSRSLRLHREVVRLELVVRCGWLGMGSGGDYHLDFEQGIVSCCYQAISAT